MENKYLVPNVIQYGEDGFGHQLEGIMGVLGLHFCGKINYVFNYNRRYKYQHSNIDEKCIHYLLLNFDKFTVDLIGSYLVKGYTLDNSTCTLVTLSYSSANC